MATYYDPSDPYNQQPWPDPYAVQEAQPDDPNNPYPGPGYTPPGPTPTPTPTPTPEPTPAPGPTANPWHTAPTDGNWQAWFRTNLGRGTLTPAELQALAPDLMKAGVSVLTNAKGIAGKVRLPNGQIVDVIQGADSGGNTFTWQTGSGTEGGSGVDINSVSIDPSYLAPWTGSAPGRPNIGPYVGPGDFTETFTPDPYVGQGEFTEQFAGPGEFAAPTGQDVMADPSYLWRVEQGRGAIENAAAAKGVLNSGGTLTDILNYGQKAASQEYGNVWDRAFGAWNAKWGNALNEYSTRLNAWNTNASNKRADYETDTSAKGSAFDRKLNAWNANSANALNTYNTQLGASDSAYNKAWQAYVDAKDTWYRNQNEPFNKLLGAASLGASAAR